MSSTKTPEQIRQETQTKWNTLSTPIYDEFVSSDQSETTYNVYLQKLKTNYADFKHIDIIISSYVKTNTYDTSKIDWLAGLKAAEKSCKMETTQNQVFMVMDELF